MTAVWSVLLILTGWWPGQSSSPQRPLVRAEDPAPAILTMAERLQSGPADLLALERSS